MASLVGPKLRHNGLTALSGLNFHLAMAFATSAIDIKYRIVRSGYSKAADPSVVVVGYFANIPFPMMGHGGDGASINTYYALPHFPDAV